MIGRNVRQMQYCIGEILLRFFRFHAYFNSWTAVTFEQIVQEYRGESANGSSLFVATELFCCSLVDLGLCELFFERKRKNCS